MKSALPALALLGSVSAMIKLGPVGDLHIRNEFIKPDGFVRAGVLSEGVFPGPLIAAQKDDRFRINVINELFNRSMVTFTSIHWHGLFQKTTAEMDGAAFVSQCPIVPGSSFLYDFAVPGQAGTFWYHSHVSTQYCDGLRGPLVIYDPEDPHMHLYDVDNEYTVITLADWYHVVAPQAGLIPQPNATLINGLGRQPSTPDGPLAVINVEQGKRYRFRLISISCDPNFVFSIEGHTFSVIEADGVSTHPVATDSIRIFAGQRYSFVLHANQTVDNYWIHANPDRGRPGFDNGLNSAILRYAGAPERDPGATLPPSQSLLHETSLAPLELPEAPGAPKIDGADVNLHLVITVDIETGFKINGVKYVAPTLPILLQILSGAISPKDLIPSGSVYALPRNKSVQISVGGGGPGSPHPFHLHGHTFDVIRSAGSTEYNFDNPVRRDVVSIGDMVSDNATIRFRTDNPGPWFLHCHIDWHLDFGLAIIFVEDAPEIAEENPVNESWLDLCPKYNEYVRSQG